MTGTWTLTELVERAERALLAGDVHARNARVTAMPDARVIRWYTTIGLVDRPSAMRGRTALYRERHLLQLVAIKRRQAQGHTLAHIQAELANATDGYLREVAQIPPGAADRTHPPPGEAAIPGPTVGDRSTFWAAPAAARAGVTRPAPVPVPGEPDSTHDGPPGHVLSGVPLADGVHLLIPATPNADDLAAIATAARPLLELLAARGLTTHHPSGRKNR